MASLLLCRVESTFPIGARNTELKRLGKMRKPVSKNLHNLLSNCGAQRQWIHLSLFGLEHHALLLWIPNLALEILVNMATWTTNGESI